MSRESLGLPQELQQYLLDVSLRDDAVLKDLRDNTARRDDAVMQIAAEQGQFMNLLVKLVGAHRILEIGTFTGYSALAMALALPENGQLVTLDLNSETTNLAHKYWARAGVADKIKPVIGPALESLARLQEAFDLVFIDADKTNYQSYFEEALRLTKSGGVILVDNVLWSGRVADPNDQDSDTQAIRAFNEALHKDERVDISLLPLADGLTLARRK